MNNKPTQTTLPKLRFPEFQNAQEWKEQPLNKFLNYQQPEPYLVSDTGYRYAYAPPDFTAVRTFIFGCANNIPHYVDTFVEEEQIEIAVVRPVIDYLGVELTEILVRLLQELGI